MHYQPRLVMLNYFFFSVMVEAIHELLMSLQIKQKLCKTNRSAFRRYLISDNYHLMLSPGCSLEASTSFPPASLSDYATVEETDEEATSLSDGEFSRHCNCSPPGNCLDCRNVSSLYDFGNTPPALPPIPPRRSIRLQQLCSNLW